MNHPTEHHKARFDRDDVLERSLAALRDAPVPDGPSDRAAAGTLAALRRAAGGDRKIRSIGLLQRVLTMTFSQRLAAAVAFTIGGLVIWFMLSLFSSVSYADVARQIRAARSMTCTCIVQLPAQKEPVSTKMLFLDPGHLRQEGPGGTVAVTDTARGEALVLDPTSKTARLVKITHSYGPPAGDVVQDFLKLADQQGEPIGEREIGGVKAKGFRVKQDGRPSTVWADPKTGAPLRVEMTAEIGGQTVTVVMSDVVVDPKLDPALFDLKPPEGYEVITMEMKLPPNVESAVLEYLRTFTKFSGGKFPAKLNDFSEMAQLAGAGENAKARAEEIYKMSASVGALFGMLFNLEEGKDYDYTPGDAKLGDADKIIFWQRDKKTGKYRAIYGDLSVKDVAVEDLHLKP
jgi:hypothetical protein